MKLSVKVDVSGVARDLQNAGKQVRYGIARGLTRTANDVRAAVKQEMGSVFDRPTPWTLNSMYIKAATRDTLTAKVGVKGAEAAAAVTPQKTLAAEVQGGARSPKRFDRALQAMGALPAGWVTVPSRSVPRDQFGNVDGNYLRKLLQAVASTSMGPVRPGKGQRSVRTIKRQGGAYFVQPVSGKGLNPGIYLREVGSRTPMAIMLFRSRADYRQRLDFQRVAERTIADSGTRNVEEEVQSALATAH